MIVVVSITLAYICIRYCILNLFIYTLFNDIKNNIVICNTLAYIYEYNNILKS